MRLFGGDVSVDDLLEQHRAILEYERYVKEHTWLEVEAVYTDGPPVCGCVICQQLEAFSDKLVTVMRDLRLHDNAPDIDGPRLETVMRDLLVFSASSRNAEQQEFQEPTPLRKRHS